MDKLKVYWSFDPYADTPDIWSKTAATLSALKKNKDMEIRPIYFLDNGMLHWYGHVTPQQVDPLIKIVKKVLESNLKDYEHLGLAEPEVVYTNTDSRRGLAKFVTSFLDENSADLIALSTHARSGLARAYFGSYAESLLQHCHIPQLLVSPNTEEKDEIHKVLYPTDLSDDGFKLFEKFLKLDYGKGTHLDLYSKIIAPNETYAKAMATALGGGWVTIADYDAQESKKMNQKAQSWKAMGDTAGVEVATYIDGANGRLEDRVIEVAEELGSDLIVMPSFVGKIDSVLLGSRAVEVIRNSKRPVLVQHFKES